MLNRTHPPLRVTRGNPWNSMIYRQKRWQQYMYVTSWLIIVAKKKSKWIVNKGAWSDVWSRPALLALVVNWWRLEIRLKIWFTSLKSRTMQACLNIVPPTSCIFQPFLKDPENFPKQDGIHIPSSSGSTTEFLPSSACLKDMGDMLEASWPDARTTSAGSFSTQRGGHTLSSLSEVLILSMLLRKLIKCLNLILLVTWSSLLWVVGEGEGWTVNQLLNWELLAENLVNTVICYNIWHILRMCWTLWPSACGS